MVRPSSVDPDKVQKCVKYLKKRPFLTVPEAMKQTNFSAEEVANLSLRQLIRQSLPGKTLKGLKAHALGSLTPPPPQPDRAKRRLNRAIDDEGRRRYIRSPPPPISTAVIVAKDHVKVH